MPRLITPGIVAEFRRRLCAVASDLLAEKGVEGFNMREVARRLRVSPMTTYRYFRDKDEILQELRAEAFARLADRLQSARTSTASPVEATAALASAYAGFAFEQSVHYRLMFDLFQPSLVPSEQEYRLRAVIQEQVHELVGAGVISGHPEALARVFWSLLHGAIALQLTDKIADVEQVLAGSLAAFLGCDRSAIDLPPEKMSTMCPAEPEIAAAAA